MNIRILVNLTRMDRERYAACFNLEPEEYLFFLRAVEEDLDEELTDVEREVGAGARASRMERPA